MADNYSTGSVSDTVQRILERRRGTQRQALLDQLGIAKVQLDQENNDREFNYNKGNADRNFELAKGKDSRDALNDAEGLKASVQRRLSDSTKDMSFGESDASGLQTNDKELFKYLMEHGRLNQEKLTPKVSTSTDFQPPADATPEQMDAFAKELEANPQVEGQSQAGNALLGRYMFKGSDKYQEAEDGRKRIDDLGKDPNFSGDDPLKMLLAGARGGINVPASVMPSKTSVISPGGKLVNTIKGRGADNVVELNHPPQANAANQPSIYQVPDGKGGFTSHWLRPGEQPAETNKVQSKGPLDKGDLPTTPQNPFISQIRPLLQQYINAPKTRGGSGKVDEVTARAKQSIMMIAQSNGISPDVVESVTQALAYAKDVGEKTGQPVSLDQLMGMMGDATPEELKQANMLIRGFYSAN